MKAKTIKHDIKTGNFAFSFSMPSDLKDGEWYKLEFENKDLHPMEVNNKGKIRTWISPEIEKRALKQLEERT